MLSFVSNQDKYSDFSCSDASKACYVSQAASAPMCILSVQYMNIFVHLT